MLMWQRHQSGQTVLTDPELIWEIFLSGLVLPILGGVILGYIGRTAIERDKIAEELELRRTLVTQMQEVQSWPELAELVVATPGNVVSADRAWLIAQRSDEEEFDQIAHWKRPGSNQSASYPLVNPNVCENCSGTQSLTKTRILTCRHTDFGMQATQCTRYCLWLTSEKTGKSALLFDLPSNRPLDTSQIKVLDNLGDEISLAIDNANLQYVRQRQADIVKNERQKIARDLHDTLGQNISYLRLKLEQLSASHQSSDQTKFQDDLANMLLIADEAYEQVRDTLEELRATEHPDLEESIELYATQAAQRTGFSVQIHSNGQPQELSIRKSRQMMYIVREAINNIEKHANAQNVDIYLQWHEDEFRLTVRDNGKGFNIKELNTEERYGITIMKERSLAINADLTIASTPGNGTELTLCLHLSNWTSTGQRI